MVTTRYLRGFLASLILSTLVFVPLIWAADHAEAAEGTYLFEDFAIPNPTRPPTVRTLLTIDTSEIAGQTCQVVVDTVNGESVHADNYITVTGGVPTITVTGTEDGAFGVKQNATTVVMGDTLVVNNHFQRATSVEGDVIISCQSIITTTTTVPDTSSTTTTVITSTTTTPGPTTTQPPASTTTTVPSSTSSVPDSTTTTSPSSSTTSPDGSTSTTAPPTESTEPPPSTPPTLPDTGPAGVAGLAMAGAALLLLGFGLKMAGDRG